MIIITPPKSVLFLPSSEDLNGCLITMSSSVCNQSVTLDQSLPFRLRVAIVCRLCYLDMRRISSVRYLLTDDATWTLLCGFVLSRLDYCNALVAGYPKYPIKKKDSRKLRTMLLDLSFAVRTFVYQESTTFSQLPFFFFFLGIQSLTCFKTKLKTHLFSKMIRPLSWTAFLVITFYLFLLVTFSSSWSTLLLWFPLVVFHCVVCYS